MNPMNQSTKKVTNANQHAGQFNYLGRWVDKATFTAFVYDKEGQSRLAKNYNEFEDLTTGGIWYESKMAAAIANQKGKHKHVTLSNG